MYIISQNPDRQNLIQNRQASVSGMNFYPIISSCKDLKNKIFLWLNKNNKEFFLLKSILLTASYKYLNNNLKQHIVRKSIKHKR